ncbi:MAG: cell division protein FtsA [Acidobacteria bacterium]|nr:cell division protein FtsA [Acidobacteriota bacterium]
MAKKDRYIVGIDIGSNKTCALVCQPAPDSGKLEVAGLGVAESRGWRKGVIVNLDAAVLSLKKAVEAAESSAGVPVDSAYVGVAGPHVKGVNSRGAMALGQAPRGTQEVTRDDIRQVIQTARGISLPPDRSLIHVLPQEFLLDSQNGIRDPIGMLGSRLEVNVHLVMASASATQNVVTAVNRAGVVVRDTVFEPLASAEACLTADERELGVALVDIGGGSSDLIVYYQGSVRHTAVIPLGGDHFTNDIAVGLRTPIPEAEKMKRLWGERDPSRPNDDLVEVSSVGGRPTRVVSYAILSEIIEPRALELLELLDEELGRSGYGKQLGAGVVLAGGGAKLGGLPALAEKTLGLPVRVGKPAGLLKMGDVLTSPAFATVVGLVAFGNRMRLLRDARQSGWAGKIWNTLRGKAQ